MRAIFRSYLLAICTLCIGAAPKPKNSLTYDQKQTGEYNVQLHLKDFQIIAVVGDESFGSLGDYDYNYDYSDFTVKPFPVSTTSTTIKPETSTSASSTTKKSVSTSTSTTNKPEVTTKAPLSAKPVNATTAVPVIANKTENSNVASSEKPAIVTGTTLQVPPGQIPVIVQETSPETYVLKDRKKIEAVTIVSTVDDVSTSNLEALVDQANLGEIMHLKRCAQGYSRDKRGRCRKIRRPPQIPIEITRFASNLAARFRQADKQEQEGLTVQ